jgi:hypothetical protein
MKKLFFIVLLSSTFNSCFVGKAIEVPKMKKEFTVINNAIPSDFAQKGEVLMLVLEGRRSYDGYLERAFKNNYSGDIELVTTNVFDKKYKDITKYRYFFAYDSGTEYTFSNGSGGTAKRFFIFDRLEQKKYSSGAEFSFFAKAMKIYAKNLEAKRLKK